MPQHHNLMTTGRQLRRIDCSVVGLGAAVGEERFLQTARRNLRQLLGQIRLGLVGVKRRGMRDRIDLFGDRFVYARVRVAYADGQHAAEAIQVLVAFIVPDVKALAFDQRQRFLVVIRDGGEEKFLVFADGLRRNGGGFGCAHLCKLEIFFKLLIALHFFANELLAASPAFLFFFGPRGVDFVTPILGRLVGI